MPGSSWPGVLARRNGRDHLEIAAESLPVLHAAPSTVNRQPYPEARSLPVLHAAPSCATHNTTNTRAHVDAGRATDERRTQRTRTARGVRVACVARPLCPWPDGAAWRTAPVWCPPAWTWRTFYRAGVAGVGQGWQGWHRAQYRPARMLARSARQAQSS